jgi:hypothetical protein
LSSYDSPKRPRRRGKEKPTTKLSLYGYICSYDLGTYVSKQLDDVKDDVDVEREMLQLLTSRKPLVHLLLALLIASHGSGGKGGSTAAMGLPTRRLLKEAGTNNAHSWIKQLAAEGYIMRVREPQPDGIKGNDRVINRLTPKGLHTANLTRMLQLQQPQQKKMCKYNKQKKER